jgi:hydrogenase-4 component F
MSYALFLIPALGGILAFFLKASPVRRSLLAVVAVLHASLTAWAWARPLPPLNGAWIGLDATGLLFLSITSTLFLVATVYALAYLSRESQTHHVDIEESRPFSNEPEAVFIGCLLLFLAAMSFVTVSHDFGLLWVGVESTTLASAPLIAFHRQHRSLEATWKYLFICSVGIALALLGNFLLAVASVGTPAARTNQVEALMANGAFLRPTWLKAAFVFFLVGYGTKMGLAPLHNWLPDAHSESPSVVSALLSGALLNCAFLGILRIHQVCLAAGIGDFSQELLRTLGLVSMAVAAIFILNQVDYKRMLAYSSVEHMGILALGVGLGGAGVYGSALHAIGHSLTKAALFLIAGNILATFGTKAIPRVTGLKRVLPVSGLLWLLGFLAITGSPPFATFLSELTILRAALDQGYVVVPILYLILLAIIFIGMTNLVLPMVQGRVPETIAHEPSPGPRREAIWSILPPSVLGLLVLGLGIALPAGLSDLLHTVARSLGGS